MKKIIIVGASGMGREIYSWLSTDKRNQNEYIIKGFIDDNPNKLKDYDYSCGIINSIENYKPAKNEMLINGILDPEIKMRLMESLVKKGATFLTFIHSSAILGANIDIGEGTVIAPLCILTCDIKVGDFVFINTNSTIGHDTTIGNYTSINGKVEIPGNVVVGKKCLFGVGASTIPRKIIADNAVIGAGSVVIRNVAKNTTVFGNPAKRI